MRAIIRLIALGCATALLPSCASPPPTVEAPPPTSAATAATSLPTDPVPPVDPVAVAPPVLGERTAEPLAFETRLLGDLYASVAQFRKTHRAERDPSCDPATTLPASAPIRLRGRGPAKSVEIVRLVGDMACATVERCSIAIESDKGWVIAEPEETCTGVIGPGTTVARRQERLTWVEAGDRFLIEYQFTMVSRRTQYGPSAGAKLAVDQSETRWLVLCGIGASKEPSCTAPVMVSCADAQGKVHGVSWRYDAESIILESEANPDECVDGALILGSHRLDFR